MPLWGRESWVPIYRNVARPEAYMLAKFHLDPSNCLATMHQHYRQDRWDRQTDKRSPKNGSLDLAMPF